MRTRDTGKSLGRAVIESFEEFLDAASRGDITARTVKLDLEPKSYSGKQIKVIRKQLGVSQAIFAELMAVSVKLVQAWEADRATPQPIACRLLDEIALDPLGWLRRQLERHSTRSAVKTVRRGTAKIA